MKNLTKTMLTLLSVAVLLSFTTSMNAQDKNNDIEKVLAPFPNAGEGMVRHVIEMKKKSDESLYKVEIIPGKVMSVDCNHHSLMGKLEEKDLQGWGYTYYEFTSDGQTRSTMMACNKPNENKFVSGQTLIVRYNSKLPIVVYAPKGYEVKYRIWKADKEKSSVEK
ncbi:MULTISPECIES: serine protease inhibitor ecotin [unclassified Dysgonomonas]|jgi:ecotin|uniref:serine protease inhibitor ecotin n=1 Tax=unclassified Dysgonomonas TaxID=2630389 RepID=UPI0025C01C13|nr:MULTISPECIES: serine protease inhibitor ecotin [unclassified Dysgonomonas]MDR2002061.1 serine protease inhibitor ecotin [Prevotella sp.]HMM02594.1 serine protease inhibitor ecotin [Dysgonomonas sp.]